MCVQKQNNDFGHLRPCGSLMFEAHEAPGLFDFRFTRNRQYARSGWPQAQGSCEECRIILASQKAQRPPKIFWKLGGGLTMVMMVMVYHGVPIFT